MTEKYEYNIGLEIHIKLNSKNKLFCKCKNIQDFDTITPNSNICPVCSWQPWALPVLNKEPLQKAILLGLALNCEINELSYFDRKSYFYPDLPLGFQISQFNIPTNWNGYVNFFIKDYEEEKKIRIERAHIENDAGKTIHEWDKCLLDYNRAWTPLVEIVTYPDFTSSEEVIEFIKELQRRVRFNNIWDANMEKGQLRCDVNISIKEKWSQKLWSKVELKNINSFWAIDRAIDFEFKRQSEILENWGQVQQATRGWNDEKRESYLMRSKEEALDYRYFPEPDLPLIKINKEFLEETKQKLTQHSYLKIKKYKEEYKFNKEYINALIQNQEINELFESCIQNDISANIAAKFIISFVIRTLKEKEISLWEFQFTRKQFFEFLKLLEDWKLMENQSKKVFFEMLETWKNPWDIMEEKWLKAINQEQIKEIVKEVLSQNPHAVEDIKKWENKAIGFLIWEIMKRSWGKADPKKAKDFINEIVQE